MLHPKLPCRLFIFLGCMTSYCPLSCCFQHTTIWWLIKWMVQFKKIQKHGQWPYVGGSNYTWIFCLKKILKLLNAPKHILYIVGNFLIDICSGTLVPEVLKVNLTGQKLVVFLKSPVGFNRKKNNSPLYTEYVSGHLEAFEALKTVFCHFL